MPASLLRQLVVAANKRLTAIKQHVGSTLVSGGVLAVFVAFLLMQLGLPAAKVSTSVVVQQLAEGTTSNSFGYIVKVRSDGDIVLEDVKMSILFSPTSGKPTITGPALSASPSKILDSSTTKWTSSMTYEVALSRLMPDSEVSLTFNSDQLLEVIIEVLEKEIQSSWVYRCKPDKACRAE